MLSKIGSCIWTFLSKIIIVCFRFLFKLVKKEMTTEQEAALLQFCKFALVGVTNTLVSAGINFGILLFCNKNNLLQKYDIKIYVANTVAFILSVLWSYYWNNKYVFTGEKTEQRVWWKVLLRTYAAYAFTGLGISNLVSYICVTCLGISEFVAVWINLVIAVPINYLLNKFWAYGEKGKANS